MAHPLHEFLKKQRLLTDAVVILTRKTGEGMAYEIDTIEKLGALSAVQKYTIINTRAAIMGKVEDHFDLLEAEIADAKPPMGELAAEIITEWTVDAISEAVGPKSLLPKSERLSAQVLRGIEKSMTGKPLAIDAAMARIQGKSYKPLSTRVYRTQQLVKGQVNRMINQHLARGSSGRELARDIRQFVKPTAPGGLRGASLRLGRTELNNAFHAVSVDQAQKNPYVIGMVWHLSGSHPRPDACNDYEEHFFRPHEVPNKPHPNCFCYVTPETLSRGAFLDHYNKGGYSNAPELKGDHSDLAPDAVDSKGKPYGRDVVAAANQVHAQATKAAGKITTDLQNLLPEGAKLEGLQYRVKTPDSLAVKIRKDVADKGLTPKQAAGELFDSVRYTQLSSPDRLAADVNQMLGRLRGSGYEVTQIKNTWENTIGNPYYGVNVKLKDQAQPIELQFHTPESLEVKNKLHGLYDQQKLTRPGSSEWQALNDQMTMMSGGMMVPPGVHDIH